MINKLISLANDLDASGSHEEANKVDALITAVAQMDPNFKTRKKQMMVNAIKEIQKYLKIPSTGKWDDGTDSLFYLYMENNHPDLLNSDGKFSKNLEFALGVMQMDQSEASQKS